MSKPRTAGVLVVWSLFFALVSASPANVGAHDGEPTGEEIVDRPTVLYVVGELDAEVVRARAGHPLLTQMAGASATERQVAGAMSLANRVVVVDDDVLEARHFDEVDLAVISASTRSQNFRRFLLKATTPIVAMKPANWVTLGLARPATDRATPLQRVRTLEVDRTHPIAKYLTGQGDTALFESGQHSVGMSWAPSDTPSGARAADVVAYGAEGAALVAFDAGDDLANPFVDSSDRAIACRVAFPSTGSSAAPLFSSDGLALFMGAVEWSLRDECRNAPNPIGPSLSTQMCQTDAADETRFAKDGELVTRTDNDEVNLSSLWVRAVQYVEVDDNPIVFLGGRFQRAYDAPEGHNNGAATRGVQRSGVFGCNLNDGTVTEFEVPIVVDSLTPVGNAVVNERVRALAYDGTWLYVGGKFTIDPDELAEQGLPDDLADQNVSLIRVNPRTGDIDPLWIPNLRGSVSALEVDGNWLYVGGGVRLADDVPANRLVRLWIGDGARGRSDLDWRPEIEASVGLNGGNPWAVVLALEVVDNTLVVGGSFQSVNGVPRNSLAAFNVNSGNLTGFAPSIGDNNVITDPIAQVKDIAALADGSVVACGDWWVTSPTPGLTWTAYDHDGGEENPNAGQWFGQFSKTQPRPNQFNSGKFSLSTGAAAMVNGTPWGPTTDGGIQACDVDPKTNMVILGGHYESVGTYLPGFEPANDSDYPSTHVAFEKLTAVDGDTGEIIPWDPDVDSIRGLDAVIVIPGVTPDDSEIIVGGAMTTVDRSDQNGLARFRVTE